MSQAERRVAVVTLEGRGDLPFLPLREVPLVLHVVATLAPLRALGLLDGVVVTADADQVGRARALLAEAASGVVLDAGRWWADIAAGTAGAGPLLLVDPLCPLVPQAFVAELATSAVSATGTAGPAARAAYRPVTDTLKDVVDDRIVGTLDRDGYAVITSPVLLPAGVGPVPSHDYGALVARLRERGPVELVEAPSLGRRVGDAASVLLLECADDLAHEAAGVTDR